MTDRVIKLYQNSWVGKYYTHVVREENGIVYFANKLRTRGVSKEPTESMRFDVYVHYPNQSKPYFLPWNQWETIERADNFIEASTLSNITHGFKCTSHPTTTSLFYTAPYFIVFKNPNLVASNVLRFKSFFKPNYADCILAMVIYVEEGDYFVATFSPDINLHYNDVVSLNNTLEFLMIDSKNTIVTAEPDSQLLLSLNIPPT